MLTVGVALNNSQFTAALIDVWLCPQTLDDIPWGRYIGEYTGAPRPWGPGASEIRVAVSCCRAYPKPGSPRNNQP